MSEMTIEEIKEYLPHRYPFLLIDRVVAFEKDKRIVAIKNVTVNEPVIPGDQLRFEVEAGPTKRGMAKYSARAMVGETLAAEAQLLCALREL